MLSAGSRPSRDSGAEPRSGRSWPAPRLALLGASIAILIPCFWHARIQATDLSSHLYNAWLAGRIGNGGLPGLTLVPVWTNVLTDWCLSALMPLVGPVWAERLVVGSAVLVFFWGAFFLLRLTTGRRPWELCPLLAMLSYGLVFRLGFLNFYLATGLSLWILGLLWSPTWRRGLFALPLAALAVLAHGMPLVWALAVALYLHVARRVPPPWRRALPLLGLAALALLHAALSYLYPVNWSWRQLANIAGLTGIEQVWINDQKYLLVAAALLLVFVFLLQRRLDGGNVIDDPPVQIWLLHLAALALLPSAIQFPGYQHVLAFITQRLSLFAVVSFLIMVGGGRPARAAAIMSALVAAAFFACIYVDEGALNRVEDEVAALVRTAPRDARVVASIVDRDARFNGLIHVADRACIRYCFSYANYEPATAQFRIRLTTGGLLAAPTMAVVQELERGEHTITADETPLYAVCACASQEGRLCLRSIPAGERACITERHVSKTPWLGD